MTHINGLRFIVGTKCNYKCFYCHHEGCFDIYTTSDFRDYEGKIALLQAFCLRQGINEIAITGGEPFLFMDQLRILINYFGNPSFHITINTNATLIIKYIDWLRQIPCKMEFHINLSTLNPEVHRRITLTSSLDEEIQSLHELSKTHHSIKLNIICLRGINDGELLNLYEYAKSYGMYPRYLVYYDTSGINNHLVMGVDDICQVFNAHVHKKFSYGIIRAEGGSEVEIVKCMCIDKECSVCKKNTFMHMTPDLNIKYCQNIRDVEIVDYSSMEKLFYSFEKARDKLNTI